MFSGGSSDVEPQGELPEIADTSTALAVTACDCSIIAKGEFAGLTTRPSPVLTDRRPPSPDIRCAPS